MGSFWQIWLGLIVDSLFQRSTTMAAHVTVIQHIGARLRCPVSGERLRFRMVEASVLERNVQHTRLVVYALFIVQVGLVHQAYAGIPVKWQQYIRVARKLSSYSCIILQSRARKASSFSLPDRLQRSQRCPSLCDRCAADSRKSAHLWHRDHVGGHQLAKGDIKLHAQVSLREYLRNRKGDST
jgi:hypothetical protein